MMVFQRQLMITVALAGLAGFGGVWVGARSFQTDAAPQASLRSAVGELTQHGLVGLTDLQKARITQAEARYAARRARIRSHISYADSELADALVEEMGLGPKVEKSIEDVKRNVGELQHATVEYVVDLRNSLTSRQQIVFDERVVAALMTAAP